MSTKKEYLKDGSGKIFAPIVSLGSLNIPDGEIYCNEDDMSFNFKLGKNTIKINDNGKIFCEEVIERDGQGNIPLSNAVYAKVYTDGTNQTLVLSNTPDFTYSGTLVEDYGETDNDAYQYNEGGSLRYPLWHTYSKSITKVDIISPISPTICYCWFFYSTGESSTIQTIQHIENLYTNYTITMERMFNRCDFLTSLDLGNFDTSNVTNMKKMFYHCYNLKELVLTGWDTSKVTDMSGMFGHCTNIKTLDVSNWNTSNVINMSEMFNNCYSLKSLDVSNWNTSKVTNMSYMFYGVFSESEDLTTLDVSHWDTSNVTDMSSMFEDCFFLDDLNVTNWDTSKVINMSQMFMSCQGLTYLNVSGWDTSNVTKMDNLFGQCAALGANGNLDLTGWNTSKVTTMESMFDGVQEMSILDLGSFDTSSVTNMDYMFRLSGFQTIIVSLNGFVTTNVTSSTGMFEDCESIKGGNGTTYNSSYIDKTYAHIDGVGGAGYFTMLVVATFKTGAEVNSAILSVAGSVNNISQIRQSGVEYDGAIKISTDDSDVPITVSKSSSYPTIIVWYTTANRVYLNENCYGMFKDFTALESIDNLPNVNTSKVKNMSEMFRGCNKLSTFDLSAFNTSNATNMAKMFMHCYALKSFNDDHNSLNVSSFNTKKVTNFEMMFYNCKKLTKLDLNHFDTPNVATFDSMFLNCEKLEKIYIDKWNTSKAIKMGMMFDGCEGLLEVDVSNFDMSNVTDIHGMFYNCNELEYLDVSSWDTSKITNMYYVFKNCYVLQTLDVSHWDTSNVTNMREMFYACQTLTTLNVGNFNTDKVTQIDKMFAQCLAVDRLNVKNFNVSNVTNLDEMFDGIGASVLDLTNWDTSKVTSMNNMFRLSSLKTIYASDLFVTTNVTSSTGMFEDCESIKGGNGTTYDSNHIDKSYAKIDKTGQTGYFTEKGQLIFDAVDTEFSDGRRTRVYEYDDIWDVVWFPTLPDNPTYKYSHTSNISDNGTQNGNYGSSVATTEVIKIEGADQIRVTITASGESTSYDWACVWDGNYPSYTAANNYSTSISGKLGGTTRTTNTYIIDGDTVTIAFKSDGSGVGDGYGYYAVITNVMDDSDPEFIINVEDLNKEEKNLYFMNWYEDKDFTIIFNLSNYTANTFPKNLTLYAKMYNANIDANVKDGEYASNYIIIYQ